MRIFIFVATIALLIVLQACAKNIPKDPDIKPFSNGPSGPPQIGAPDSPPPLS